MSQWTVVVVVAAVWLAIGFTLWLTMGRRGHDGFSWLVIGTLLGPIGILLALDAARHGESTDPLLASRGRGGTGPVDLLVGADGSPESRAALDAALRLLGSSVGRVTLLRVVPFDGGIDADREALTAIRTEADRYPDLGPDVEVRRGHPATVIADVAEQGGYGLVVIGTQGAGRHAYGSAARELATASRVPVLLVTEASASIAHGPAVAPA
jgi:nucleotide-binding universal stress UspA family protein